MSFFPFSGPNSCQGDSGGPMVIREFASDPWYQIGIVSFGLGTKCQKGIPGFYTKVDAFLPWIEKNLKA